MQGMKKAKKLTPKERDLIAIWKSQNISIREIARRLDRHHSSIIRELKRNRWQDTYVAIHAQAVNDRRQKLARKKYPLKNHKVYSYVLRKLRDNWSPEEISGRLKLDYPNDSSWHICHETIYQYIYTKDNQERKLWEYLPRKQKRRKKWKGRTVHRSRIPDRVSIHLRPQEVENKKVFGHWEGDSIVGKAHKNGLHTEIERKTRFLMAEYLDKVNTDQTVKAQSNMYRDLPKLAKKSTTVDNGREFTGHKQFNLPVYFADPYSSWQRGSNEYHNGLIRRYFPKGTDFSKICKDELIDIIYEINNRPRKCLNYYTPKEKFEEELQKLKTSKWCDYT
jgi:IS30 family transposase